MLYAFGLASLIAAGACGSSSSTAAGPSPVKCQVALTTSAAALSAGGGTGAVTISTEPECAWSATAEVSWISGLSPASGQGNGQMAFLAPANASGSARQGAIVVNGNSVLIRQDGTTCAFEIAPLTQSVVAAGGTGRVTVTTGSACAWSAASGATWITIGSGAAGTGNGSVEFDIAANTGSARNATLTIAGRTFQVAQEGIAGCAVTIAPSAQSLPASGGAGAPITVSAAAACSWSATSNDPWITLTSGATGSGNGSVSYTLAANTGNGRTGTIAIGGQIFTVSQAGSTTPSCSYAVAPTTSTVSSAGGPGATITVTTSAGCAWTSSSNAPWITVTSGATGTGNGSVGFSAPANAGGERTGTITVAGQTVTVTQPAPAVCEYGIAPVSQSIGANGGAAAPVVVSTASGCAWTARSNATWITITSGDTGVGSGSVAFTVAANTGAARSGTITIAGRTFTLTQAATSPCAYTIAPLTQSIGSSGGAGTSISVSTADTCTWTAAGNEPWLTVISGESGTGSGTVAFNVDANGGAGRTGALTVAGRTVTVTQDAVPCTYAIGTDSQSIGPAGGPGAPIAVSTFGFCSWTSTSNAPWLAITSGATGTGDGSVGFTVAANTGAQRAGTLTIAGEVFTVTQSACAYAIAPQNQSIGAPGGAGTNVTVTTTAGCAWTAVSNAPWLTITSGGSGNGNGSVAFTIAANTGAARTGTLTIAGQTFTVTQAAAPPPCTYAINPTSQSIGASGGPGTAVSVTTAAGCAWTATSNAPWLTITSGASGNGNGSVAFTIAANTGAARTGTLTIGGQTFTVTQAAAPPPCTYGINPTGQSIGASGGPGTTVSVTTAAGCAWTAASNAPWLTITSGASGNGNGSVAFTIAANTGAARTGTLTIAGQTFTVTQSAVPPPCSYAIAPTSSPVARTGGSVTVTVTTAAGCTWTSTSNAPWITITSGASGTGTGPVVVTAGPNTGVARTGTATIAGQTFTVTQP